MVTLEDVRAARRRLEGVAFRTPLVPCPGADPDRALYLKPENLQPVGSFKIRGAYNRISSLPEDVRRRGVVAHSSGNHAQAVAYAARALGVPATVVMPEGAPAVKRARTEAFGAEVVVVGPDSDERRRVAEELAAERGLAAVEPYDDEAVIAGQGTVGLEVVEDLPEVGLLLVPVSGGGLISGVATAVKALSPRARVIGVEPELAADAQESLRRGEPVAWPAERVGATIADGLRVRRLGKRNWPIVRDLVDDIVLVSDDALEEAVRRLALRTHLVAEPSGAATFAAWLFHQQELGVDPSSSSVAVLSGGNIDPAFLARLLATE